MNWSPQKRAIYEIFKDGEYHCSTEIPFIRDYRKRISEMNRDKYKETGAEMFESKKCDRCKHKSNVHMYRLKRKKVDYEWTDVLVDGVRMARRVEV